jgi:hypothetical protein
MKIDNKKWENVESDTKIAHCEKLLNGSKASRRKFDFKWYLNHMFLEGNHYISYNSVTNSIERPPKKRGEVRATVNKINASVRAIRNYCTRSKPKWEVIPFDTDEETIKAARRNGKLLDYVYHKLHLETLFSSVVDNALLTSVGWVELGWDEKASGGMGEVSIDLHDPFNIWVDPDAYMKYGKVHGRYIIKTIKRSLEAVKADERYDKKTRNKVETDEDLAASDMKARIIRKERGEVTNDIPSVSIREVFLYEDEENEEGGNIRLLTYGGGQVLRDEAMPDTEFPLYLMQIPMDPLKIYHNPWVSDAIPLNKLLDRSLSQKIMYVNQALVYRLIAEKGHGVKEIPNEMGSVVEVNPNRKFEQMPIQALPQTLDSLSSEVGMYVEDILGSHDAALGRLPAGARSGRTLEALQAADSNNLEGIIQSLESFLSVIGKRILEIIADKYTTSRVIRVTEPEEGQEFMKVIGSGAEQRPEDTTVITGEDEVVVKIGSWLGYTREAQRETLLKLGQLGIIPAEEILRQFEFANINELSEKARSERLEQHVLQAEIAGRNQGGEEGGQGGGQQDQMVALADKENTAMMNGEALPPTEGADMRHNMAHRDFIETNTFASAPDEIKQIIITHTNGEAQSLGLA